MPQPQKPFRLWLKPAEPKRGRAAVWTIKGPGIKSPKSTGCAAGDVDGANRALARHIAAHEAREAAGRRNQDPSNVAIATVLTAYWTVKREVTARPREFAKQIANLNEFLGDRSVDDITKALCQKYAEKRGGVRAGGLELAYLKAAINLAYKERILTRTVPVWVPPLRKPRERWLTRDEMARLLWAAWRFNVTAKGALIYPRRHTAMFILVARYTGSRAGAICAASFTPEPDRGWVDLDAGVFHRAASGSTETSKRKPSVRLPDPLLAHLRRWHANRPSEKHVVEWKGKPVASVKKSWAGARKDAGLGADVTPHVLRHTAATWMMQNGADMWDAAGFLGMTVEVLQKTYGHHHPDFQSSAHAALTSKRSAKRSAPRHLRVVDDA